MNLEFSGTYAYMHESDCMHLNEVILNNSLSQINLVSFSASLHFETGVSPIFIPFM